MKNEQRIQTLPLYLANQIAAGEVIERPASVLKELLENSIDANSRRIEIRIEKGGMELIRVADDGDGICQEDLALAILPHSTSKIATLADLENVGSFGFRGEALASINAVSRLTLSSYSSGQEFAWRIEGTGREAANPVLKPAALSQGSIVEVRHLFYNTPARRKFMRSEKTEGIYLEEIFKRIALSHPMISFKFEQGDRIKKNLPACGALEEHVRRVAVLCGASFVEGARYIEAEVNGLKVVGWLGTASVLRAQADLQYFYVNGRAVRDKVVMHAVRQAYQSICEPGRYPAYILYFELDAGSVDVNVHPTKHEVRFRDARTVHAFLVYAIQEGLQKINGISEPPSMAPPGLSLTTMPHHISEIPYFSEVDTNKEVGYSKQVHDNAVGFESIKCESVVEASDIDCKLMSIQNGRMAFVEDIHGIYILDVVSVRHAMMQPALKQAYESGRVDKRALLIPESIVIEADIEAEFTYSINWDALGFEITVAGERLVWVRSVPALLGAYVNNLPKFLGRLLTLNDVNTAIDLMIEYKLLNDPWSDQKIKQWWLETATQRRQNPDPLVGFYKKMTAEEIRKNWLPCGALYDNAQTQ